MTIATHPVKSFVVSFGDSDEKPSLQLRHLRVAYLAVMTQGRIPLSLSFQQDFDIYRRKWRCFIAVRAIYVGRKACRNKTLRKSLRDYNKKQERSGIVRYA